MNKSLAAASLLMSLGFFAACSSQQSVPLALNAASSQIRPSTRNADAAIACKTDNSIGTPCPIGPFQDNCETYVDGVPYANCGTASGHSDLP